MSIAALSRAVRRAAGPVALAPARPAAWACLALLALAPALAPSLALAQTTLACPAASALVQVAPCPTEEQLRISYVGYCSDNRRLYDADSEACSSLENYLRRKNLALWESPDGRFEAYLSCQADAPSPAAWPAPRLAVTQQGKLTLVRCTYGQAATLTHRTRARCVLADAAACSADPAACRARCESP
jgi:hypothetical protein